MDAVSDAELDAELDAESAAKFHVNDHILVCVGLANLRRFGSFSSAWQIFEQELWPGSSTMNIESDEVRRVP